LSTPEVLLTVLLSVIMVYLVLSYDA
jgi:hypothetical protein